MEPRSDIIGWGADADPSMRPGVPRELPEPRRVRGAWWDEPERQADDPDMARPSYKRRTPMFGTAQPACGLSGLIRKSAYRIPEYRTSHWLALLLSDRVNAVEWALGMRGDAKKGGKASVLLPLGSALAGLFVARTVASGRAARSDTRRVERERKIHAEHVRDRMPIGWRVPAGPRVAHPGRPTHS